MKKQRFWKAWSLLLMLCMAISMSVTVFADTNPKVTEDTNGVMMVMLVYKDDNNNEYTLQKGSGFLINETTLVTCHHVVNASNETIAAAAQMFQKEETDIRNHLTVKVSVIRDERETCKVNNSSEEMDYAVLTIDKPVYNRHPLVLRSSDSVQVTEECYALGFPAEVENFQDVSTYVGEDVTIESGRVNKINSSNGVNYIQSSSRTTSGYSGGPLVDENGNVIGICRGATGDGFDTNYWYAIASSHLIQSLEARGISFDRDTNPAPTPEPIPTPESVTASQPEVETGSDVITKTALSNAIDKAKLLIPEDYSTESYSAVAAALNRAQEVFDNANASQTEVDNVTTNLKNAMDALTPASSAMPLPVWAIALIAALVVAAIIIILILALGRRGGKDSNIPTPRTYHTPRPNPDPDPSPGTSVLGKGGTNTTLLNRGIDETTTLNNNYYGRLIRKKNHEDIPIYKDRFVIGKLEAKVDYCVNDNQAVSREHVAIIIRGGNAYVADLDSTNGTFVNNIRVSHGEEKRLNPGDKLTLGDEEFTFNGQ